LLDVDLSQVYPTKATECAVRVALFSWRFVIPVVVFVLCYGKIISYLRRRAKVAVSQRQQPAAGPSTSTAASSHHSKAQSKTQKNVIKTMIIIISLFIICWLPLQAMVVVHHCGLPVPNFVTLYYGLAMMAAVNSCANPFIYATGMYPFLREKFTASFRRLMCRKNQVSDVSEQGADIADRNKRH